uniref:Gamma-glutamyl phosphate reductase n=1 Tax=uncultured Chloroflexi bacterium HF0500_03M05 TaxID=710737 RepID=E0XY67_9CHLR|nr:gamma-glutamyl phosphate reductase [uncultured Chloroflexi bacterium HF0500_03M05]
MKTITDDLDLIGANGRKASRKLSKLSGSTKDRALIRVADELKAREKEILSANVLDYDAGRRKGLQDSSLDRLLLTTERLETIAAGVRRIAAMPDPLAETFDARMLPNGLRAGKRRVPLGVIGAIYESRPNITVDIATLCLKSGNAVILRGGREAFNSNYALAGLIRDSVAAAGMPEDAVQFVSSTDRSLVGKLLKMKDFIDLIIPRGGAELVRRVASEATMPAITGGVGVCHTYIDSRADVEMAVAIVHNAKVSRPYVCNALDTVLVHSKIAPTYLPRLATEWAKADVEMHCDRRAISILGQSKGLNVTSATDEDWGKEFLSLTAAIKIVDSMDEALYHITNYGSGHTEAIVTEDYSAAERFLDEVDSGVVLVNASTRFNDGGQFGLGAEVAISTNKMHARGPIGLKELTSYKWTVRGTGQVRD